MLLASYVKGGSGGGEEISGSFTKEMKEANCVP